MAAAAEPLRALLGSLPIAPETAESLCARVEERFATRLAEGSAGPDEALVARVGGLERRLVELNQELQQRRRTIPGWVAQRLEEGNQTAIDAAVAADLLADDPSQAAQTQLALIGEFQQCSAVASRAEYAGDEVQRSLQQARDLTAQLSAMPSSAAPTDTDRAIRVAPAEEKENGKNPTAAVFLRKRLEATCQQQPGAAMGHLMFQ